LVTRLSRGKRDCGHGHRQLGAAQPKLDLGILGALSDKKIILGVIDLSDAKVETAETVAARIRHGLKHVAADRLPALELHGEAAHWRRPYLLGLPSNSLAWNGTTGDGRDINGAV
jgi:hypothetical protein